MYRFGIFCVVLAVVGIVALSSADIPKMINYQGQVTDTGGTPVSDGTYDMEFELYDASSGGLPEWQSGTVSVNVSGGYFSVLLGESPQDSITLSFEKDYWLEVTVEGDVQSPRQQLGSMGYSYISRGLVPGAVVSGEPSGASMAVFTATNMATTGTGYGLYGEAMSTGGIAVRGRSWSMTGQTYGGYFEIDSPSGAGVAAIANASTGNASGVFGATASTSGSAIYGYASASTGTARAIYGQANCTTAYAGYFDGNTNIQGDLTVSGTINASGMGDITAVYAGTGLDGGGTSGDVTLNIENPLSLSGSTAYEGIIKATNTSINGIGLRGVVNAATGVTYGVQGEVYSTSGRAIHGYAHATTGTTYGVFGTSLSSSGRGVYGKVSHTSGTNYGLYGESVSTSGRGVYGYVSASTGNTRGVWGEVASQNGYGVYGLATDTEGPSYGVRGEADSPYGYGVAGYANATDGNGNIGVLGYCTASLGYGVWCSGDFAVTGAKSCVVRTSNGPSLMYCQESPENWFEDFGEGQLVSGRCHIDLDPLFLETVTIDGMNPMKVFLQACDESCLDLVLKRGMTGFDVVSPTNPDARGTFIYRVVAKRKGFEEKRLDYCSTAERDPYLYPEYREKLLREREERRAGMED